MGDQAAMRRVAAASDGCYEASRAAALSGVPQTTVYWWARSGIVVPSVSPTKEKLWSYADLMALRIVSWLRHAKPDILPRSPMPQVRTALATLGALALPLWDQDQHRCSLLVDQQGFVYIRHDAVVLNSAGQPTLLPEEALGLTEPFKVAGLAGPDLVAPRPHLRIVPSKVSGEPHIQGSRITTITLSALASRGYSSAQIAAMYDEPVSRVDEALDLERQLTGSALAAA
jgi:uncharacterized protein (DUF433 family)